MERGTRSLVQFRDENVRAISSPVSRRRMCGPLQYISYATSSFLPIDIISAPMIARYPVAMLRKPTSLSLSRAHASKARGIFFNLTKQFTAIKMVMHFGRNTCEPSRSENKASTTDRSINHSSMDEESADIERLA